MAARSAAPKVEQKQAETPADVEQVTPESDVQAVAAPKVEQKQGRRKKAERVEQFERTRPDGVVVVVKRSIDTGEQTVTEK